MSGLHACEGVSVREGVKLGEQVSVKGGVWREGV